jgi:hypothetical protein
MTDERELLAPVELCLPDGRLNRAAVGWSRRPLVTSNLRGHRLRKKRWDYWVVASDDCLINLTYADVDFLCLASVYFVDFATGRAVEKSVALPLGLGGDFPDTVGGRDVRFDHLGLRFSIAREGDGTRLRIGFRKTLGAALEADVLVERPTGGETLNVVVPWSDDRFQFTSKQVALPARGEVRLDGTTHPFGPRQRAFACLDHGRGVWPRETRWNWSAAAGVVDGRTVGFNLGAGWTDGTGVTENGLVLDGRLEKIGEPVTFTFDRAAPRGPWRVRSPSGRIDLTLAPLHHRRMSGDFGVAAAHMDWSIGRITGSLVSDGGERLELLPGIIGWAEDFRARW